TGASAEVCLTISSSSLIEVSSSTFIERPGQSQVTSAMPSASVSSLKFLKAMCCSLMPAVRRVSVGGQSEERPPIPLRRKWWAQRSCAFAHPTQLNPLDDGRGAHAAADAQGHQRGLLVGALELVEHGAKDHRAGRAERMAQRDRPAIDV